MSEFNQEKNIDDCLEAFSHKAAASYELWGVRLLWALRHAVKQRDEYKKDLHHCQVDCNIGLARRDEENAKLRARIEKLEKVREIAEVAFRLNGAGGASHQLREALKDCEETDGN